MEEKPVSGVYSVSVFGFKSDENRFMDVLHMKIVAGPETGKTIEAEIPWPEYKKMNYIEKRSCGNDLYRRKRSW